jgi:hypothetical protein
MWAINSCKYDNTPIVMRDSMRALWALSRSFSRGIYHPILRNPGYGARPLSHYIASPLQSAVTQPRNISHAGCGGGGRSLAPTRVPQVTRGSAASLCTDMDKSGIWHRAGERRPFKETLRLPKTAVECDWLIFDESGDN